MNLNVARFRLELNFQNKNLSKVLYWKEDFYSNFGRWWRRGGLVVSALDF